jgi:3-oxoacyl-[acyl-carrier protein] reductase
MAYAASKGALNTLTLSLARALAPEVRVNAVCPGFVDTRWTRGAMDEESYRAFTARVADSAPLKRMTMPEDVAEAALWFIEGGRSITGQFLVVDGGNHLNVNLPLK